MEKDSAVSPANNKRLQDLAPEWGKDADAWRLKELTLVDLRLLLEHHKPLQDLIRAIAASSAVQAANNSSQQTDVNRSVQCADEQAKAEHQIKDLEQKLAASDATKLRLSDEKQKLEITSSIRQKEIEHLKQQVAEIHKLANSKQVPKELIFLRQDTELAQQLGLANLPTDDTAALIHMVAVLSQRDNLERLWQVLKDRCESLARKASSEESGLLQAALSWYNHNWQSRPYQLISPAERSNYDYERQLRSRHSSVGENVAELRLFGIADGSDKPLCKALVSTR